jgi:hypothetical protein
MKLHHTNTREGQRERVCVLFCMIILYAKNVNKKYKLELKLIIHTYYIYRNVLSTPRDETLFKDMNILILI